MTSRQQWYHARWIVGASLLAACGSTPPPVPQPVARRDGTSTGTGPVIALRADWHARVDVDRIDSIILTLPSGDHQLQRYTRHAVFALDITPTGEATIRLDSFTTTPAAPGDAKVIGASWTDQLSDTRLDGLHVESGGEAADRLTRMVRDLLPTLPVGGAQAGTRWTDSSEGPVRVDVFSADERRTDTWTVGSPADRGTDVLPVRVHESFEQLGDGYDSGTRMTMTAQGRRSAVYYLNMAGRLTSAQVDDSVAMLISIPSSKQMVPTQRFARTSVRYLTARAQPD